LQHHTYSDSAPAAFKALSKHCSVEQTEQLDEWMAACKFCIPFVSGFFRAVIKNHTLKHTRTHMQTPRGFTASVTKQKVKWRQS
jgi:hypothetical protein